MKNFLRILIASLFMTPHLEARSIQTCPTDPCVDFITYTQSAAGPDLHNMGNFTMMIMFRVLATPGGNRSIVSKGGATLRFILASSGRLNFIRTRGTATSYDFTNPFLVNNSYQLGCSVNIGGTVDEFVNCYYSTISIAGQGNLIPLTKLTTAEGSGPLTDDSANGWRIGAANNGLGMAVGYFNISSGSLTQSQMQEHLKFVHKSTYTNILSYNIYASSPAVLDFGGFGSGDIFQGIEDSLVDFPVNLKGGPL